MSMLLSSACCDNRCLAQLSVLEIEKVRKTFKERTQEEQKQFLLDSALLLTSTSPTSISPMSSEPTMMLEGKHICKDAFVKCLSISQKRYRNVISLYRSGVSKAKRKTPVRSEQTKCSEAKAWMKAYFDLIGDRMPHIQRIHLPQFLTKNDIYIRMKRELREQGLNEKEIISLSTFYRFWKTNFREVLIPQVC